jgi:hypothetical protein
MIRLRSHQHPGRKGLIGLLLVFILLSGCALAPSRPTPPSTPTLHPGDRALSQDELATLSSLEELDDYPLYSMHYSGDYSQTILTATRPLQSETAGPVASNACPAGWGCSLFAALGDPAMRLYGRNFDWRFSPAVLLFTDPPDGYASVSMVDIAYLGFSGLRAKGLTDLPLLERQALLVAPALPFDGMNEQGLAVGMAAVPPGEMHPDANKKTIDELVAIREILDHAATVDEAVDILSSYNIDMGNVPLHYLIASASGNSALVEFYRGRMVVFRNEHPWQLATNFLVASTDGDTHGHCARYDHIDQRLQVTGGQQTTQGALGLLADVSQVDPQAQSNTQWSIVYDMTNGDISVVMGREYSGGVHTLQLNLAGR